MASYNPVVQERSNLPAAQARSPYVPGTINNPQTAPGGILPVGWTPTQQMGQAGPVIPSSPVTPQGQIQPLPVPVPVQTQPPPQPPKSTTYTNPQAAHPANSTYYNYAGTPLMGQTQQTIMHALQNPVMGPQVVNQMKGGQRDAAALLTKQLQEQNANQFAGTGTYGGGAQMEGNRDISSDMASKLLSNFRDIDIAANQANRDDLFRAANAAQGYTQLDEGLYQQAVQSALQNKGFNIQSQLGNRGLDVQTDLGWGGINATREGNRYQAITGALGPLLGYQTNLDQTGLGYAGLNAGLAQTMINALIPRVA